MEDDYGSSPYDDDYYNDNEPPVYEEEDDSGKRKVWEVLSWIVLVFTLVLNLLLVGILLVRRNAFSVINKGGISLIVILFMVCLNMPLGNMTKTCVHIASRAAQAIIGRG
jgi:hypothetical protein